MSEDTLNRIWTVFEEALDYEDAGARRRFVNERCGENSHMAEEVRSLLDAHETESLLDDPVQIFAPVTSGNSEQIGPYLVQDEIGRGGMGVVYKAYDERLNRLVALKMLPRHLSEDEEAKARLAAEARAAAQLEHPNIATVYDIGEAPDGRMYIAMAYYDGKTLEMRIGEGPLPLEESVDILSQVARGLDTAHGAGVIHRDIKPANILLTGDGSVKILDFGIAKVADLSLTRSGQAIGTVAYMSPEQACGQAVDHRSDIWSLGVVLYEMLTGEKPFTGRYNEAVLYAIVHEAPPAASSVRRELPSGVDRAVVTALQKEPGERFESGGEFAAAVAHSENGRHDSTAPPVPSAPERVRAAVVVAQLSGYLELVDQLVPDKLRSIAEAVRDRAATVLEKHDGMLHEMTDESLTAIFGVPSVHEDDFVRAVRAARDLHKAVRGIADDLCAAAGCEFRLSSGIDTGSVVTRPAQDGGSLHVSGKAIQTARRLSLRAGVDEILISPDTERLVRPFFKTDAAAESAIRTSSGPLTPFRVVHETGSTTRLEAARESGLTEYAGRERDLEFLLETLEQSTEGAGQMIAVIGEAGMGKSRLLYEFGERVTDDVEILRGRCVPHAGNISYLPFIGVLRGLLELSQGPSEADIVERVLAVDESLSFFLPLYMHLLTVESEQYPIPDLQRDDLRIAMVEAISGIFTLSTRERPLVMLLEDWHWSDEASQEVLKQLADLAPAHAMMVVVTYRPEYQGRPLGHHAVIHLNPLEVQPSRVMISSIIGASHVPEELGRLLHQRTGGNPFFLEEVCRALLEENVLTRQEDSAVMVRSVDALDLPDTVQAVIRARLHRLGPQIRKTIRIASVAGREFSRRLLHSVLPETDDLAAQLEKLGEFGLIQKSAVLPEVTYRFKHALTQEVVYDTLLHHQRKSFHHEIGKALEDLHSGRVDEHLDLFIHHFSLAEDWCKAARYSRLAAGRATRLGQIKEAATMLENALDWLEREDDGAEDPDERIQLLLDLERACETMGERARQQVILDELKSMMQTVDDRDLLAEVDLRQGDLHVLRSRFDEAERSLESAMKYAESAENEKVYRRVLRSIGFLRWYEGRTVEAVEINEKLLDMHLESGEYSAAAADLLNLQNVLLNEGRYDDALRYAAQAEEMLDSVASVTLRTNILVSTGTIYGVVGETDRALGYLERAVAIADEHGLSMHKSFAYGSLAHVYLEIGENERSLAYYRESISLMREVGQIEGVAKSLSVLGQVLLSLKYTEEALITLTEAAEWFRKLDDVRFEAETLARVARIYEDTEDTDEAEKAWQRIAELLEHLDPVVELDVVEAFGRLARRRGEEAEALSHYHDAIELAMHLREPSREASLRNTVGILEWNRGRYQEALAQYEQALPLFEAADVDGGVGLMLNSMAACLRSLNRHEEALDVLHDALAVHRQTGNAKMEAHALSLLGDVFLEMDRTDAALKAFSDSLQLRWDLDDRQGEGWMLQRMARAYAAQADAERALSYGKQALEIARELDDSALAEACRTIQGERRSVS